MTHYRRFEFKKRRFCSQPSVANLPTDFSDRFVEDLKSKIYKNDEQELSSCRIQDPISEEFEEKFIDKIRLDNHHNGTSKENNGHPVHKQDNNDSVFKSANWLSDKELIFSLTNQVGGLVRALRLFQELGIALKHVESRKSKRRDSEFEIFVDIDCIDKEKMRKLVHHLRHEVDCLTKEEFERSSKSSRMAKLEHQSSIQPHPPLSLSQSSYDGSHPFINNSVETGAFTSKSEKSIDGADTNNIHDKLNGISNLDRNQYDLDRDKALLMQPSIDYGKFIAVCRE